MNWSGEKCSLMELHRIHICTLTFFFFKSHREKSCEVGFYNMEKGKPHLSSNFQKKILGIMNNFFITSNRASTVILKLIKITQRACLATDCWAPAAETSDSVGLGWGPRICISYKCQVMLIIDGLGTTL